MKALKAIWYEQIEAKYFNLMAFCIVVLMTSIAYSNTLHATFHFDDIPAIVDNSLIKNVSLENILTIIFKARPVVYLSIMLNYQLSGLNVVGWHLFNIGIHAANSFLVYLLIVRTLTLPSLKKRFGGRAKWMALFCGLLFAVHPIQTESVTYIISRTELLAAFFYLGALLFFISGAQTGKWRYYLAAFVSSILSMGSKEWAITLPAIIFLYDYLFLSERDFGKIFSRWGGYVLILLSCWVVLRTVNLFSSSSTIGFSMRAPQSAAGGYTPRIALTAWTYLLTSCNVIWTYIRLLLLPIGQNIDYDYPVATSLFAFPTLLSFVGHLTVIGGGLWLFLKRRWVLVPFGVAWFYITLSPVQSFVPIKDVIFEHRLYLPSVGFFLVFIVLYEYFYSWITGQEGRAGDTLSEVRAVSMKKTAGDLDPSADQRSRKSSRKAARRAKKK